MKIQNTNTPYQTTDYVKRTSNSHVFKGKFSISEPSSTTVYRKMKELFGGPYRNIEDKFFKKGGRIVLGTSNEIIVPGKFVELTEEIEQWLKSIKAKYTYTE